MGMSCYSRPCATLAVAAAALLGVASSADAGAYIFAGGANPDIITHPSGYTGVGGVLNVTVGIDPTSANASDMLIPAQNVITVWNEKRATIGNLVTGGANNIPSNFYDFESALLHEVGHSLGLSHVNAASESGLPGADRDFTKALRGGNGAYDLNVGPDGVRGTGDDLRGDDVNLNWFNTADNNPFALPASGVFDSTTFARDTASLPGADTFAANGSRALASLLGLAPTESVMQQGQGIDEAQRLLTAEDVAGIRFAESGIDELQGTADDYVLNLVFAGLSSDVDIRIDFDDSTGFASSSSGATAIGGNHLAVTSSLIRFNPNFNWFFNTDVYVPPTVPEPGLAGVAAIAGLALLRRRRA